MTIVASLYSAPSVAREPKVRVRAYSVPPRSSDEFRPVLLFPNHNTRPWKGTNVLKSFLGDLFQLVAYQYNGRIFGHLVGFHSCPEVSGAKRVEDLD
jgi:hypothetical protein